MGHLDEGMEQTTKESRSQNPTPMDLRSTLESRDIGTVHFLLFGDSLVFKLFAQE